MRRSLVAALVMAGTLAVGAAQAQSTQAEHLARVMDWLAGEWNNHEQVWQQQLLLADPKANARPTLNARVHWTFKPLSAPNIGDQVFQLLHAPGDRPDAPDQVRLARFSADESTGVVRAELFALPDAARWLADVRAAAQAPTQAPAQAATSASSSASVAASASASASATHAGAARWTLLRPEQLQALPGCSMGLRYDATQQAYRGALPSAACLGGESDVAGPAAGAVDLALTDSRLSIGPARAVAGVESGHSRKVRYFDGWVWFKLAGPQAATDDKATRFMGKVRLHSEGGRVSVTLPDGSPSPYVLELAQLTYQNTRQPILKFALIERATGKSLTYIWANTEATRIGMNLGWFQSGLAQKAQNPHFAH